jgi:hypothetical protein
MRVPGSSKAVLDAVGLVIALVIFAVAADLGPPAQIVLLGVATSFVFLAVVDILLAAQASMLHRARAKFFGPEITRGRPAFVYPDFEPHREVRRALREAGVQMRYQRPTSAIRGLADFWIDVPHSAASNDIEAILYVAGIFGGLAARPDVLMTDRAVIAECDRSFLSFGLGSSACTYLYLEHAGQDKLFDLLPEPGRMTARMFARTSDGRDFHSDAHNQYGMIVRYAPDRIHYPDRRWFLIGGLGPQGTVGAAWYLANHWRHLARHAPADQDFAAFISVPAIAPKSARFVSADICVGASSPGRQDPLLVP